MSAIRPDATPVLAARGFVSAASAWKGLLLLLALNALLALALARPVASSLHGILDPLPQAGPLVKGGETTFLENLVRNRPDVLGLGRGLSGVPGGAAGSLLALGLLNALAASVFAGAFAARFANPGGPADLGAFLSDAARFAPSSLALSAVSVAGIGGAWLGLYFAPGRLYEAGELTFEWEAIGLTLLRVSAFLLAAGLVRMTVLAARAAMGASGRLNPVLALGTGAGRVIGHPVKSLVLEGAFGAIALLPLAAWGLFAPVWDGEDPWMFALFVGLQQLLVLWRISARAAHLGAVAAWLKRRAAPGPV